MGWQSVEYKSKNLLFLRYDPHDPYSYSLLAKIELEDLLTKEKEEFFQVVWQFNIDQLQAIFKDVRFSGEPGEMEPVELTLTFLEGRYKIT